MTRLLHRIIKLVLPVSRFGIVSPLMAWRLNIALSHAWGKPPRGLAMLGGGPDRVNDCQDRPAVGARHALRRRGPERHDEAELGPRVARHDRDLGVELFGQRADNPHPQALAGLQIKTGWQALALVANGNDDFVIAELVQFHPDAGR